MKIFETIYLRSSQLRSGGIYRTKFKSQEKFVKPFVRGDKLDRMSFPFYIDPEPP